MAHRALVSALGALAWLMVLPLVAPIGGDAALADAPAAAVSTEPSAATAIVASCADCHDISGPGYARNPHLVLNRDPELAAFYGVDSSCTACHGDAAEHIDSGGEDGTLFGFGDGDPAVAKSEACLTCHSDAHPRFFASAHAQSGLACTDCHSIHADGGPDLLTPPAGPIEAALVEEIGASSAACSSCHGGVLAEFQFNERHRLHAGVIGCVDCHSPHEPESRIRLGAFKADTCITCHQDKGGPFVFEHGSQVVDGCVACHTPHGSPNRHMLATQSVADLCYSCHVTVPGFHTRFTSETVCTNCHVTIHGSNFDAGFLE
ncbi:MAG: hypothetical protein MI919_06735 [Holophagales bacterium]|nr:hypothetical protein [Holophagales bacterium]